MGFLCEGLDERQIPHKANVAIYETNIQFDEQSILSCRVSFTTLKPETASAEYPADYDL